MREKQNMAAEATLKLLEAGKSLSIAEIAVLRGVGQSAVRDSLRLLLAANRAHVARRVANTKYFAAGGSDNAPSIEPAPRRRAPSEISAQREDEIKELALDLLYDNPEWSMTRGMMRAQIEYAKGRRSEQATNSV